MNAVDLLLELDATLEEGAAYYEITADDIATVLPELLDWAAHRDFFHPQENAKGLGLLYAKWKKKAARARKKKATRP